MNVLIACEESQTVCIEFRRLGHNAYSCDIEPCSGGHPEWHLQCDVKVPLSAKKKDGSCFWDLVIAHPPCTYLCNSGVRWLYNKWGADNQRWDALREGIRFFRLFIDFQIKTGVKMAIENPIPHNYAINGCLYQDEGIGKYSQIIHPWQHGHGEKKSTCLWLFGLPKLEPTDIVEGREQKIWKLPPSADRAKLRSKTFTGIAKAFAQQWGDGE